MKKNVLLLLLMMVSVPLVYGQKDDEENENDIKTSKGVKITKSAAYPVIDASYKGFFKVDDGILAIKSGGAKNITAYTFQKFEGEKLNEKSRVVEVAVDEKINKLHFTMEGFLKFANKIYYFYTMYDPETTTERLFARQVNTDKGGFQDSPIELISVPKKISSFYGTGKFSLDFSEDRTKMIVRYNYVKDKKSAVENKLKFGMAVFNSNLEKEWENDVQMPYENNECTTEDFTVDSKGRGYFLLKKVKKLVGIRETQDPNDISYEVFEVTDEGKGETRSFQLDGNLVKSIIMKENGAGNIVVAGYFTKPRSYAIDGVFAVTLGTNGEFSKPSITEFTAEFIKSFNRLSERREKKLDKAEEKGELGMRNLQMDRIQNLRDGGMILTGEIYYTTTTTSADGKSTRTVYHYDDVILTKIDKDGTFEWMKKIPKRSTHSSYRQFNSDSFMYISFRDNVKNQNLTEDMSPFRGIGAVVTYKIDLTDGNHDYKVLFNANKIDDTPVYQIELGRIIPITDSKFAIETYIKNKQDMMFQIEFE